jgi:hypothetical protein
MFVVNDIFSKILLYKYVAFYKNLYEICSQFDHPITISITNDRKIILKTKMDSMNMFSSKTT